MCVMNEKEIRSHIFSSDTLLLLVRFHDISFAELLMIKFSAGSLVTDASPSKRSNYTSCVC